MKSCEVKTAPAIATASSSSSPRGNEVAHPWRSQQQGSEEVEEEVVQGVVSEKEKTDEKLFSLDPVMQLV